MGKRKCRECNGTGVAEHIGGWPRPCEACYGEGEIRARAALATPEEKK